MAREALEEKFHAHGSSSALTVKCKITYLNVENLFSSSKQLELSSLDIRLLLKNWKDDPMVDVTFKINQKELKAHKFILASNSKVFRIMFSGDYKEKSKDVIINDFEYDVMVALFDYIYLREMKSEDVSFVLSLAAAANKYDIDRLYKICISFALENLFAELFDENVVKQKGFQLLRDKKFMNIKDLSTLYKYHKIMDEMLVGTE